MPGEDHVRVNRRLWNEDADDYQRRNAPQIRDQAFTGRLAWGTWNIPESELDVPGGLLAFTHLSPIYDIAFPPDADHAGERLVNDYFGLYRMQDMDGTVEFNLPYGTWIRLFRDCGLVVEDLIEPRPAPGATSTYRDAQDLAWSRRWPAECIWRLRRP